MFPIEQEFVDAFCSMLSSGGDPWSNVGFSREFNYRRGKTDVLMLNKHHQVIALEAKLRRWRDALQQAFRSTSYAHRSYVLMPQDEATRAYRNASSFVRRSVGLCFFNGSEIVILIEAGEVDPVQPWLTEKAKKHINNSAR